jgi:hypothetical protein
VLRTFLRIVRNPRVVRDVLRVRVAGGRASRPDNAASSSLASTSERKPGGENQMNISTAGVTMIFRPPQRPLGHYRVASDAVVPTINGDAAGFAMNTSELRAPLRIVARVLGREEFKKAP